MGNRLHSIAAGVMIDVAAEVAVAAAAAAGWPAAGIWFDRATWSPARQRALQRVLDGEGIVALDIEPIIIGPHGDDAEAIVEAGAALGARNVLFTSRIDGPIVVERFALACDLAAQAGMTVACEFLPMMAIDSLAKALDIVRCADRPNGGVLVDNLHLRSVGSTPADIARVAAADPALFPYVQIADAPAAAPEGMPALIDEALNGRWWPGEGDLPVDDLLAALPDIPISYEVRSSWLRERFPDPVARAEYGWSRVAHLVE